MSLSSIRQFLFDVVQSHNKSYRPDIDGLRAIAVLAVVVYHYSPSHLPGGFIGVDIFFVISGYLITGILAKTFEVESFGPGLLKFYQHRVRRIFPALILLLGFCLAAGWLFLFSSEYATLGKHIASGAGFVQNIVLWREAGYFDTTAIQKPLLHLWSLAVEEQFYIAWPLVLWVIMRRRWPLMASITAIAGASFALNIWGIWRDHADATFYLPVTRAWELMVGSWLAIGQRRALPWLSNYAEAKSWAGLGLIVLGLILIRPDQDSFPGFWALLPVVGTALIINAGPMVYPNRRLLSSRSAVTIGLISYPLYLWHWALLSMTVVIFGSASPTVIRTSKVACLVLSFVLSWFTYRWIEQPIRKRANTNHAIATVVTVAILGLCGLSIYAANGLQDRPYTLVSAKAERYLASIERSPRAQECFDLTTNNILDEKWSCTLGDTSSHTWITAYGDSHALSLMPTLDRYGKEHNVRVIFAGVSACPPLLNTYPERAFAAACLDLSRRMATLAEDHAVAAVILIARWTYYTGGTTRPNDIQRIRSSGSETKPSNANVRGAAALQKGLDTTLARYQALNIPVVLVEDNPQQLTGVPASAVRFDKGLTDSTFNSEAVTLAEHHRNQSEANRILESEASRYPLASILNTDQALCNHSVCPWARGGRFLYFDDDHLSNAGAMVVYPILEEHLNRVLGVQGVGSR